MKLLFGIFLYSICFSFLILLDSQVALAYDFMKQSGIAETVKATPHITEGVQGLPTKIGSALGAVLSFIGIIFFALMIYAGVLWMTAAGNDDQIKKSQGIIKAALIGLIIVAAAYAITIFVGENIVQSG